MANISAMFNVLFEILYKLNPKTDPFRMSIAGFTL
jgi:hypothetical protein